MNYLIVGKNGSGKSYFCVSLSNDLYLQNVANLTSNSDVYSSNYSILQDRGIEQLFSDFSNTLDFLKTENVKVYSIFDMPYDLNKSFEIFKNIEDGIDFEDYFRYHIIYNDFIKYILNNNKSLKLESIKPVHWLMSDINGIKVPTVQPAPEDWRTAPLGAKIFYDEFQDRPEFLFDGNRPSKNPMILELSKIRHYDIDLYLITPDSDNLHKSLRKIIHVMYFIKRPHGNPNCCSVYTFDQFLSNPRAAADSKRDPKKYSAYELLQYKKSVQRLYTSAANHSSMAFQIPWKWIRNASFVLIGFILIFCLLFKIPIFGYFADAVRGMTGGGNAVTDLQNASKGFTPSASNGSAPSSAAVNTSFDVNIECRKAVNVEKPECVAWFDNLSKNNSSVDSVHTAPVSYDPNNPYDFSYDHRPTPVDFPRMSGVITLSSGKLIAIDQQGNYMPKVSQADCKRYLTGYRPFDYFSEKRQSSPVQQQNQEQPKEQIESNKKEQRERSAPELPASEPMTTSL